MADFEELKNYFRKLQRVLNYDAVFNFAGRAFVKKNKIDDLWCCILATLPASYKSIMHSDESKHLQSIICYKNLFNAIKQKCFFSSNLYQVDLENANKLITSLLVTIERDIAYAENYMSL